MTKAVVETTRRHRVKGAWPQMRHRNDRFAFEEYCSAGFSKDDRNIQLCIVTIAY